MQHEVTSRPSATSPDQAAAPERPSVRSLLLEGLVSISSCGCWRPRSCTAEPFLANLQPPSQWGWPALDLMGVRWLVAAGLPPAQARVLRERGLRRVDQVAYFQLWQRPAELLGVDHAFRGVWVPAGSHRVVFSYEDRALQVGLVVSAVTVLGLAGLWLWRRRGQMRR